METILKITNINKKYDAVHAVNNLSIEIKKGNIYGILGPNGSGKSTTLGMVLNVINPTSGSFTWFDGRLTTHEALKKVGAIIERPNFYPYMTAKQNLELVCKIKNITTERIDEKLKLVNLFKRKNSIFETFSLGMKQRLAIASALLNNPEVLILDEPTNGLDPQGIHEIRSIIQEIASNGTTILFASHLLDEVEKICTHVIVIRNGEKLYDGKVDEIITSYGLIELKVDVNKEGLIEELKSRPEIESVKEEDGVVIAILKQDVSAADINKHLHNKGFSLAHLVKRKPNLEQQFLSLTESKN